MCKGTVFMLSWLLLLLLSTTCAEHIDNTTIATCSRLLRDAEKHFYTSKVLLYTWLSILTFCCLKKNSKEIKHHLEEKYDVCGLNRKISLTLIKKVKIILLKILPQCLFVRLIKAFSYVMLCAVSALFQITCTSRAMTCFWWYMAVLFTINVTLSRSIWCYMMRKWPLICTDGYAINFNGKK